MCGITGQFKYNDKVNRPLVKKMTKELIHRGPDEDGFYFKKNIGLGMRRLKIIDLVSGSQPIHNEDKSVWTILNGEIYNYKELREELRRAGHEFYTNSDTEVIVHAFEEYGDDFVKHLSGMFAIALWDEHRKRLILARDRAGEKPLYYFEDGRQFMFASEMKSLMHSGAIKKALNLEAMHHFFVYGRVPSPYAIIKGIKKLAPATMLIVQADRIIERPYWELSYASKLTGSEDEIKEELIDRFEKAVKSMMISDVPLGAFLSGGVDSSAVVAMMAKHSAKPVETFSVGFHDEDFSELKYARRVAEEFNTNHHEFVIEPDVMDILPKLVWHMDEPFADFSAIPTYYISQATRQHVTVALTGDGGDELFAGYEWFKAIKIARSYTVLPQWSRRMIYQLSRLIPDTDNRESFIRYAHKFKRLAATQQVSSRNPVEIFLNMTTGFTEGSLSRKLYTRELREQAKHWHAKRLRKLQYNDYDGDNMLEGVLYTQFKSLLPDMFFTKVDRMSMANSLETRAPFLDPELVEFIARIPFDMKLKGHETKYIFKEALRGILPDSILFRHKKGFSLPLNRWIKEGQLNKDIRDALLGKEFNNLGYFNQDYIKELIEEHDAGKDNHVDKIWRLYMFAEWYKMYM